MGNNNSSIITIYLDRNNPFYFSGESVTGAVGLNIKQDKQQADEIYIKLTGEVGYKTTEFFTTFRGRTVTRTEYHQVPIYFNKVIFARYEPGENEITYDRGKYLWLFQIPLTDYLPPTINQFESYPFIRYHLEAIINKPYKRETKCLIVYPHVNLLQNPQCLLPTIFRKENRKKIILKITLHKLGYIPGELINVLLEIENPRTISIKCIDFSMLQSYQIERTTRVNTIFETTLPRIFNLKYQKIKEIFSLLIPSEPIPPSYQYQGGIQKTVSVKICYFLKFAVKVQGILTDFDLYIPIILGTEPNPDLNQQQTFNPLIVSYSLNPEESMFNDDVPPPSYDSVVQNIRF